jgi:DNA-binding NtrC family response regulator
MGDEKRKIKVLMVDDEEEFLVTTSRVLRRRDFEVFTAEGGRKALDSLGKEKVDVVVLDMKMPGMDGAEVFNELHFIWPELPVIVLTGHDSLTQAFEMTKRGVFDYVLKPCDIEDLAAKIRKAVDAGHPGLEGNEEDGEKIRVLLVDDERTFLETMGKVLERRGLQVFTAGEGYAALSLLEKTGVDVVVLDVKMPGMDGLEVLDRIKAAPVNREVILLTGHPTVDSAVEGMKRGAFEYLMKPAGVEDLVELIYKAKRRLEKQRAESRRKTVDEILRRYPD